MKLGKASLVCAWVLAFIGACEAGPITIQNYSFENATGYGGQTVQPSSWGSVQQTAGVSSNCQVIAATGYTGADGANMLLVNLDVSTTGTLTGTSWTATTSLGTYLANTSYTLTVGVAKSVASNRLAVIAFGTDGTNLGTVAASQSIAGDLLSTTFQNLTLTLDTSATPSVVGQNIVVFLEHQALTGAMYGNEMAFDNVRLDSIAVPEPATWVLLAFSLTGLVIFRRRAGNRTGFGG
ncbi:MAG: PEP-CTERM sorting domain-containing protein [Verrucomicrobiae bacterium]